MTNSPSPERTRELSLAFDSSVARPMISRGLRRLSVTRSAGEELWRFTVNSVLSQPTVANGTIYVGSKEQRIYAINAITGQEIWNAPILGSVRGPVAIAGDLYVSSQGGYLYALRAADGIQRWQFATGSYFPSNPTVENGAVFVGVSGGVLYSVDAQNGTENWRCDVSETVFTSTIAPAVCADGRLYFGQYDDVLGFFDSLRRIDAKTGEDMGKIPTDGKIRSAPAIDDELIVFGTDAGEICALSVENGARCWAQYLGASVITTPAMSLGMIYVGTHGRGDSGSLFALSSKTGAVEWVFDIGDVAISSPTVVNGVVYVGSSDNAVYALEAHSGTIRWRFVATAWFENPPVVADGIVYASCNNGILYAIKAGY